MPDRVLNLHFPAGGVVRSLAYQNQQPYTTPNALNVWPEDTLLGRQRGGQRPGLGIGFTGLTTTPFQGVQIYRFTSSTMGQVEYLVGAQNSTMVYDSGGIVTARNAGTATSVRSLSLHFRQRGQHMFIADHSYNKEDATTVLAYGTDGAITTSTTFDSASYTNWESLGENEATIIADYQLVILTGTANVTAGCYAITAVPGAGTSLTLANTPMSSGTGATGISFRLERCPKYMSGGSGNTTTGGTYVNKWIQTSISTYGYVPSGNHLIETWRDRCVLAGGIENPRQWYMSAIGDPWNWLYSATGSGRAVTGATQNQKAGTAGDPITALYAYNDETLWMGCSNSIYIFRGDPTFGGSLDQVSTHVGCISQYAVCRTSDAKDGGTIVWMSQDGLYYMDAGAMAKVMPLSRDKLPNELRNLSPITHRVVLQWDHTANGIYIFVTKKSGSDGTGHWFLDWGNKGFWPMSFEDDVEPYCATNAAALYATSTRSSVVLGCYDGELRQFDTSRGTDQLGGILGNSNITSWVDIGPVALGSRVGEVGAIHAIEGNPAASSGDVDWSIRVGNSPEEAYNASVLAAGASGEWNSTGQRPKERPRLRGHAAFVRLTNGETGANSRWSMEDVQIEVTHMGKRRV